MLARTASAQPRDVSPPARGKALDGRSPGRRRPRDGRRRRRPARYAALLALATVVVALTLVVSGQDKGTRKPAQPAAVSRPRSNHRFWIVRPGQTLSEIVARTGVSLAEIEALNPRLNPGALQTGQHIRVRR